MSDNKYYPGDEVQIDAAFRTLALAAIDPASVVFYVQPPTGSVLTPTVIADAPGQYHCLVAIPTGSAGVGTWTYRVESAGNPTRALERSFVVLPTGFAS